MLIVGMQPDTSVVVDAILAKLNESAGRCRIGHTEKAAWLSELLDSDEMNGDDPLLRECVQRLIENHMKAQIYQQYKLQELSQEVEAALQEQAQEAAQPMMDQQNAKAAQQQNAQAQQEQASKQADADASRLNSSRSKPINKQQQMQLKHQQDLQKTGIEIARDDRKHDQQMELAKFNAKALNRRRHWHGFIENGEKKRSCSIHHQYLTTQHRIGLLARPVRTAPKRTARTSLNIRSHIGARACRKTASSRHARSFRKRGFMAGLMLRFNICISSRPRIRLST
jgi:pyruvate/2-oxoglutarate dehydrogenase complex dihydrolipoamide acyltransferase (E2) component